MFRQRLVTAAVLVPLAVASVLLLTRNQLAVLFAAITLVAAWEWTQLANLVSPALRLGYVALIAALLGLALYLPLAGVLWLAAVWWTAAVVWIGSYGMGRGASPPWMRVAAGMMVLVPAWRALLAVRDVEPHGRHYLLFLLALVWAADTAAYFIGRRWGRSSLAPRVSPGKTWEGAWAALASGIVMSVGMAALIGMDPPSWFGFALLGGFTVLVSIVGDLLESVCKRASGVKDSSSLLPGHGGVLDRLDSLTAAAPVFMLGLSWLELTSL